MKIILCVTNDISTDRRVMRIAETLSKLPADIIVVGRKYNCMDISSCNFRIRRFRMIINKGPLFYAFYNLRLFLYLIVKKADILVANDLDTLPAVYLAARVKRINVVYDCHEYFLEMPELVGRKWVRKIWSVFESVILPHLKYSYTVSQSIAAGYRQKYGISMQVIRNFPLRLECVQRDATLRIKPHEKTIVYQGSLNIGRGLELAIKTMQFINDANLVIIGTGDLETGLKQLVTDLSLNKCVVFTGRIKPDDLQKYTCNADMGISLEEKLGLSYFYSLPNKLFDYIQARIPVLVSNLPEISAVVKKYNIGIIAETDNPFEIAALMRKILFDEVKRKEWMTGLETASQELCWENEEVKLLNLYRSVSLKNR